MAPVHRMPLRGRDEQLTRAAAVLRAASVDGRSGAIVVRGPAGAGKSRLLHAVAEDAVSRGFRLLEGSGDVDASSMPLAPLLQAVLGGSPPLMDRRTVQDAMRVDDARYVVVEDIIEELERAARERSLLVMIDDLQFSDPTTLFALRVMAERLAAEPVVWVVATREPIVDDAVARTIDRLDALNAETLSVSSLSASAATRVAEDVVGGSLDDNLQQMVDRAEGQVLDLVETLRGLVDEHRVDVVDGRATLVGSGVPTRLRDSIGRRLARLDAAAVDVVTTAAVVGRQIGVPVVAALTSRSPSEVDAALRDAERANLVANDNGQWMFRHDLIREAVEVTLTPERRRELRRAAVDEQLTAGASVGEVATALAATATNGDTRAADLLEQAAGNVASVDPSSGADLVGRAAAITVGDSAARGRLLAQQVMLLWQAGRAPDARRIGEQALMAGLRPLEEAEVRLGLARVTSEHSYLDAGRQAAAALALPGLPDGMRVKLLAARCVTKIMVNDFDGLEEELGTALQLARAEADRVSEASLLATRSTLSLHQMDWAAAFDEAERGRRIAEDIPGEASMWAPKALWQAILLSTAGSCDAALAITDQGIAEAAAARHGSAMSLWMMIRCRVLLEAGRLSDAAAEAESVLTMTDWRERSTMADYTVNFVLRRVAQYTGDPATLNRTQSGAAAMARDGVSSVRRQGKWLAAIDADTDGRPDVAVELTAEGVDGYGGLGNAFSLDPADEPLFARIAGRAGRPDLAVKAAEFTERRADRNPQVPFLAAIARHTRGLVDDDSAVLDEAVALFAGTNRPLPRAVVLEDAGRVNPLRDHAIHQLDQAHDLYVDAGALRDAARVRQRLRGLGQRRRQPRLPDASGDKLAGLTPSELAVVELVARGATNREVAAQLFLSPHTVSTHLRHAFTKVGVRSRTELARLTTLGEAGLRTD